VDTPGVLSNLLGGRSGWRFSDDCERYRRSTAKDPDADHGGVRDGSVRTAVDWLRLAGGAPEGSPGHVSAANEARATLFCSADEESPTSPECAPSCMCGRYAFSEPAYDAYDVHALRSWRLLNPSDLLPDDPYSKRSLERNVCLACDEAHSGPIFKEFAGRTRRRSGLSSAIARPCLDARGEPAVYPVEHYYFR